MRNPQDENTDTLLDDAYRVLRFASHRGLLADSALENGIQGVVDAAADPKALSSAISSLRVALSTAVKRIHPTTLSDLGSKYRPYYRRSTERTGWIFALISIVVIVYTGKYAQIYIRNYEVLSAMGQLASANVSEKGEEFFESFYGDFKNMRGGVTNQSVNKMRNYAKSYEELADLNAKILIYLPYAQNVAAEAREGPIISDMNVFLRSFNLTKNPYDKCNSAPSYKLLTETSSSGYTILGSSPPLGKIAGSEIKQGIDPCPQVAAGNYISQGYEAQANIKGASEDESVTAISAEQEEKREFLVAAGFKEIANQIVAPNNDNEIGSVVEVSTAAKETMSIFILPFLFGVVGSIVYHMRGMLSPDLPGWPLATILVRLTLGGLAGVSASFFGTPLHIFSSEAGGSSIFVFLAAFLLGFSIDAFFGVLDRFVRYTSQNMLKKM